MFGGKRNFDAVAVNAVPRGCGVYIIYKNGGEAFYAGRSTVNIHDRLQRHVSGHGSRKIREALQRGERFEFVFKELGSPHQAESVLITELGTREFGNLRKETDPADW